MDGILCLHEIFHSTHQKNEVGVILKLDFEKAYDKVNWEFLLSCLSLRGFSQTWIRKILAQGTVCVKINEKMGPYFQSYKGVRQGDPLSPALFNLVADCLTKMIKKAQSNHMIAGLISDIVPNGVAILQYADDTILYLKDDFEKAKNMKLLLYMYELMSGLKINYSKSEIFMIRGDNLQAQKYSDLFGC